METALFTELFKAASRVFMLAALLVLSACRGTTNPQGPSTTADQSVTLPGTPASTPSPTNSSSIPTPSDKGIPPASNCTNPMPLTDALTEGPYFKAGSPERASLLDPGMGGTKLVLTGYVTTPDCKPIVHALLDFWQADAGGHYDNTGYTLRGHQYTDSQGYYELETIIPGLYPGRTEHIHVKVQAPNGPVLTTQLFFPGVSSNDKDSIYDPKMVIAIQDAPDGKLGTFNFVLSIP